MCRARHTTKRRQNSSAQRPVISLKENAMTIDAIKKSKQAFLILGLFLAIAITINFFVLNFFDQKSSYRAAHSLVGILSLMGFVFTFSSAVRSKIRLIFMFFISLIPCYFGTIFSDLDITLLGIGQHRNPIFHSGLLFFLILFVARPFKSVFLALIVVGFGVGIGSHLIWDLFDQADVRWIPGGFLDSFWLGINGLFCLIFARSFLLFRLDSSKTKST